MGCSDMEGFSEVAREHAIYPRNYGPLDDFDGHARITGPCGDTMEFWLKTREDMVYDVSFITDGCGSSLACGSMATCLAESKAIEEVLELCQKDILEAFGGFPPEFEHCALLAVNTLRAACENYLEHKTGQDSGPRDEQTQSDSIEETDCSTCERKKGESEEEFRERQELHSRLCHIRHKIVVLSGKGGVGKSTVSVTLAVALMMAGKSVGLLDIDIHGPSIPTMLGLESEIVQGSTDGLLPIDLGGMKVMSIGFLLRNRDDAVIWRGPMKYGVIKQFLKDVVWGELDYLIIDSPPGTGDEPLSLCQLVGALDGAVVVTTPQKVATVDVRKSITFCRQLNVPIIGVVENMSGFVCPKCGEVTPILSSGGGKQIAEDMNVPFLGSIPMDQKIAEACDRGEAFIYRYATSPTAAVMRDIIKPIAAMDTIAKE